MTEVYSAEAETALLGALLAGTNGDAPACFAAVEPADLHLTANRLVYEAIRQAYADVGRIDALAVMDQMRASATLDAVGGANAIHDLLAAGEQSVPGARRHARIVAELARRRRVAETARHLAARVEDRSRDVDAEVDRAVSSLLASDGGRAVTRAEDVWEPLLDRIAGGGPQPIDTGLPGLGRYVRVLPGQLTVVTGVPGSGKSELVDAAALHLARTSDWKWAVYSPESAPFDSWLHAMVWRLLGHPPDGALFDTDAVEAHMRWLHRAFAWLDADEPRLDTILAQTRWLAREHGVNGLVVDPWNKVTWDRHREESTTESVGRHLATIVRFARREQVHVVVVAHPKKMERDAKGTFKAPTAYDISSSAEWFNQADFVLSVYRDRYGSRGDPADVAVHVQKVRREPEWGQCGVAGMRFDRTSRRYVPKAPV